MHWIPLNFWITKKFFFYKWSAIAILIGVFGHNKVTFVAINSFFDAADCCMVGKSAKYFRHPR